MFEETETPVPQNKVPTNPKTIDFTKLATDEIIDAKHKLEKDITHLINVFQRTYLQTVECVYLQGTYSDSLDRIATVEIDAIV